MLNDEKLLQTQNDVVALLTSSKINPISIKDPATCSIELNLYSETGFEGYKLNWLLSQQNKDGQIVPQDIHRINSGIFKKFVHLIFFFC